MDTIKANVTIHENYSHTVFQKFAIAIIRHKIGQELFWDYIWNKPWRKTWN